jgi:hypothetical protein
VRLRVESTPAGANVALNGESAQRQTPFDVEVDRGSSPKIVASKAGFRPLDTIVTPEQLAAGTVSLKLDPLGQDPVAITAEGSYQFEIVEGGRVLSAAAERHDLRLFGQHTIRLRAAEFLLDYPVSIDPAVRRQVTVKAPELGTLSLSVSLALENCRANVGGKDLDYAPFDQVRLAPGSYTVTLECPGGNVRKARVTIRFDETTRQVFQ